MRMTQSLNRLSAAVAALILVTSFAATPAKADEYKIMDIETPNVSTCLDIDPNSGVFGAFKNSCGYRVAFVMCVIEPTPGSWGASNACVDGRGPGNLDFVAANGVQASHIKGGKGVQWFACRYSTTPGVGNYSGIMKGSIVYEKGRGIKGKCGMTSRVLTAISPMPNATQPAGGQAAPVQGGAKQGQAGADGNTGSSPQGGNMASRMFGNSAPQGGTQPGAAPAQPKTPDQPGASLAAPPTNMANRIFIQPPPTPAQSQPKSPPPSLPFATRWTVRDVGRGCHMVLKDSNLMWDESGENINGMLRRLEWTGGCNSSRLADGSGTLYTYSQGEYRQGRHVETGNASNGLLNGTFAYADESDQGGAWEAWSDGGGPRVWNGSLSNGCNPDGVDPCNANDAIAMRDAFSAGLASARPLPQNPVKKYVPAANFAADPVPPSNLLARMAHSYPDAAMKAGQQGKVEYRLTISAAGGVTSCTITRSSGFPALDAGTCEILRSPKVIFQPGRNSSGQPAESTYVSSINWRL